MLKRIFLADPFATGATAALCLLIAWKLALTACCVVPVRLEGVFAATQSSPGGRGHQLLLLDTHDSVPALEPIPGSTRSVRRLDWATPRGSSRADADRQLADLIHAFGYDELPLLLTFDNDGHVVRIQAVPNRP